MRRAINVLGQIVNRKVLYPFRIWADRRFDRKHDVNTSGIVEAARLDFGGEEKRCASDYEPSAVPAVRAMLATLDIDHRQYAFIDYGSGKGRVLLLASEYPYLSITGVEFSHKLHRIAEDNIKRWKTDNQKCHTIRSVCESACTFDLPGDPLVLWFFTPFRGPVLDQVVDNIRRSMLARPRPIIVLYYGGEPALVASLSTLGLACRELHVKRPFTAMRRRYRGYLFGGNV